MKNFIKVIIATFLISTGIAFADTQTVDIDTFAELQSWVADEVLLKAGTLTDTKYCIYDSASGDIICNSTPTGDGDITDVFDCASGDCNTMTVGTSEYLTYGTGYIDANRFAGVTTVDSTEFGYLNGLTAAIVQTGSASHDGFSDFVANEHIDWTADQGATNIHTGNYTAGLTNLTDFDQTAWRLFYSNNLGDVIELSLGTDGQYLQSQGGTSSLTWSTPTDTTANETITLSGDTSGSGTTAITTTIGADKILESHLKAVDAAADEECLTYEATTGDFEWQACGGSLAINDITDITIDTPADNEVLAYNNGTSTWLNQTPAEAGLQGVLTNSAGLLAALSDETGTGLSVFSTSPTFTTGITVPNDSISAAELNEGDAFAWTSTHNFGGATSLEVPNAAAPTVDAAGEIAVDTTSDQLVYYGASKRVLQEEDTKCFSLENLAAADDDYEFYMADDAITITAIGLHCAGTCTTGADISLEDRAGNAMTHTVPTHSTGSGNTTFQAVTAANTLVAGEGLRFDVDNAVSPETDTYLICFKVKYTSD